MEFHLSHQVTAANAGDPARCSSHRCRRKPAIASRFPSNALVGRFAERVSLGLVPLMYSFGFIMGIMLVAAPLRAGSFPESLAFAKVAIPRDELRQQRLSNLHELRSSYAFPLRAGHTIWLLFETFRDGKQVGRYRMASRGPGNHDIDAKGFISIGWRADQREFVTILEEDSYPVPWTARIRVPDQEFETPQFDYEFAAIYFDKSLPEPRGVDTSGEDVLVYPVLGIPGAHNAMIRYGPHIKTSTDLVKACTDAGAHTAIVVYLYIASHGGLPPIKCDN